MPPTAARAAGPLDAAETAAERSGEAGKTAASQAASQRLEEALMAAALKDAKRVKTVEPQLEALRAQHAERERQQRRRHDLDDELAAVGEEQREEGAEEHAAVAQIPGCAFKET